MNLINEGLAVQKLIVEANQKAQSNVVPFPTVALAKKLHAQGKCIVHKPCQPDDDDFPPQAA